MCARSYESYLITSVYKCAICIMHCRLYLWEHWFTCRFHVSAYIFLNFRVLLKQFTTITTNRRTDCKGRHRTTIGPPSEVLLRFQCALRFPIRCLLALFSNQRASVAIGLKNRRQVSNFIG